MGLRALGADTLLAAGAGLLLLLLPSGAPYRAAFLALAVLLVLAGAALRWGAPRVRFASRLLATFAGLALAYALAAGAAQGGLLLSLRALASPGECVMPDARAGEVVAQACASPLVARALLGGALAACALFGAALWVERARARRR